MYRSGKEPVLRPLLVFGAWCISVNVSCPGNLVVGLWSFVLDYNGRDRLHFAVSFVTLSCSFSMSIGSFCLGSCTHDFK